MLNLQELTDLEMRIKIINELLNNELKDMCIRTWRSDDSIKDFLIDRYDVGNETSSAYCYKQYSYG